MPKIINTEDFKDIWDVFIAYDGYMDNNIYVRASNAREAILKAKTFVDEEGEEISSEKARRIFDPKYDSLEDEDIEWMREQFLDSVKRGEEQMKQLLNGTIEGYCYGSGT